MTSKWITSFESRLHAERWVALRWSGGDRNVYRVIQRSPVGVWDVWMV